MAVVGTEVVVDDRSLASLNTILPAVPVERLAPMRLDLEAKVQQPDGGKVAAENTNSLGGPGISNGLLSSNSAAFVLCMRLVGITLPFAPNRRSWPR